MPTGSAFINLNRIPPSPFRDLKSLIPKGWAPNFYFITVLVIVTCYLLPLLITVTLEKKYFVLFIYFQINALQTYNPALYC
jgi:hypothetical protein